MWLNLGDNASGFDDIITELNKRGCDHSSKALYQLISEIYETGDLFIRLQEIPMPKNTLSKKCEWYRTLNLVSHASKILIIIILRRVESKIETLTTND